MTTPIARAQAILVAAQEQYWQLDRQHQNLRRAHTETGGGDGAAALDAALGSSNTALRFAQVKIVEAERQVAAAERDIAMARGMLVNHEARATECASRARQLRIQAEEWEKQQEQALVELALARVALAELLGIGLDAVDAQVVAVTVPAPAEPAALLPSPHFPSSPRLVMEYGVKRFYNDVTGQECDITGTPLVTE